MAFDGSGKFDRVMNWQADAAAAIPIKADRHDQEDNNFADGLSQAITKDGQTTITADIPLNGHKLIGVGAPSNPTDAATLATVTALIDAKGIDDIRVVIANASGTYTKPDGLRFLRVTLVGGAGGGSSCGSTGAGQSCAGAGGGGGGTVIKLYRAAEINDTEPWVIGAGSAGPGQNGQNSTFKGLVAGGGIGAGAAAIAGSTTSGSQGGSGGAASGGDINIVGGMGGNGIRQAHGTAIAMPGNGGSSFLAAATDYANAIIGSTRDGVGGRTPGGGGSGAANGPSQGVATGGMGAPGRIIFEEYY